MSDFTINRISKMNFSNDLAKNNRQSFEDYGRSEKYEVSTQN